MAFDNPVFRCLPRNQSFWKSIAQSKLAFVPHTNFIKTACILSRVYPNTAVRFRFWKHSFSLSDNHTSLMSTQTLVSNVTVEQLLEALETDAALDWDALQQEWGYTAPQPQRPELPATPVAPKIPAAPSENDPKYDVTLSTMDKFLSSRRIKKQQQAINRFEKDRKRWEEDRLNAEAMFTFQKKNHAQAVAQIEAEYTTALTDWKRNFAEHLRSR